MRNGTAKAVPFFSLYTIMRMIYDFWRIIRKTVLGGFEMTNTDTYKLLRECNSGIQMGVSSIDDVLSAVGDPKMKSMLIDSRDKHEQLGNETHAILNEVGDTTKEPNVMAKGMSWLKTNVKLSFDSSDSTVADLVTEGCNMGVKKSK